MQKTLKQSEDFLSNFGIKNILSYLYTNNGHDILFSFYF